MLNFGSFFQKKSPQSIKESKKTEPSNLYSEQLKEGRKHVPARDRARFKHLRDGYGVWLTTEDRRQAQLMSLRDVEAWLSRTEAEREEWFERVEAYLQLKDANWQRWQDRPSQPPSEELADMVDERRQATELLGIPLNADAAEIRRAYRVASKKHHPDMGGDIRQFTAIQHAYDVLMSH